MNSFLFGSIRGAAVDHTCWHRALGLVVDVRHTVKAQLSSLVSCVEWIELEARVQKTLYAFIIVVTKCCKLCF